MNEVAVQCGRCFGGPGVLCKAQVQVSDLVEDDVETDVQPHRHIQERNAGDGVWKAIDGGTDARNSSASVVNVQYKSPCERVVRASPGEGFTVRPKPTSTCHLPLGFGC